MPDPRPALLVVNYGSHDLVAENIARTSLPDSTTVVIVDNFTTQDERAAVTHLCSQRKWELVTPSTNLGFGAGMNAAAARARQRGADVFVLLNPDAYVEGDGVAALVADVVADPAVLVSPIVTRPDGTHFSSAMELDMSSGAVRRLRPGLAYVESAGWLSGACLAVHADMWERISGFDDDYFLYWEDIDLSVRVVEAGGRLFVDENVAATHSAGGTQRGDRRGKAKSATYYFYNVRNRFVFAAQHLTPEQQRVWRLKTLPIAWSVLMRGGRRQLINPFRTLVPVIRGICSGWRYMRRRTRVPGSVDEPR